MRAKVFDTEQDAKDWDAANNSLAGNVTAYRYSRRLMTNGKTALIVGDALDTVDEEGVVTPAPDVITLTDDDLPSDV